MYQVWIPIYNRKWTQRQKEEMIEQLRIAKADLVLLTVGRILCSEEMRQEECEMFRENQEYIESHGIRVGAWLVPTIGYGMTFYGDNEAETEFTHIRRLRPEKNSESSGVEFDKTKSHLREGDTPGAYCPWDERFVEEFIKTISAVAHLGVKTIMLEDDYTLAGGKFFQNIGCACDRHMKEYSRRMGEVLTREEAASRIFTGGKNKYRDTWMDMQKETLLGFTKKSGKKSTKSIPPSAWDSRQTAPRSRWKVLRSTSLKWRLQVKQNRFYA